MSGLEIFEEAEVLHLEHPSRFGEDFWCGFGRKYIVRNLAQDQIFTCIQNVKKAPLFFRSRRYVDCKIFDKDENEIIHVTSSSTDPCCTGCWHLTVHVTVPPNRLLGSISTVSVIRNKEYIVRDANDQQIYKLKAAHTTFFNTKFKILTNDRFVVGKLLKNHLSDGDMMQRFIVEYTEPLSADDKILLFGAFFLLEVKAFREDGEHHSIWTDC